MLRRQRQPIDDLEPGAPIFTGAAQRGLRPSLPFQKPEPSAQDSQNDDYAPELLECFHSIPSSGPFLFFKCNPHGQGIACSHDFARAEPRTADVQVHGGTHGAGQFDQTARGEREDLANGHGAPAQLGFDRQGERGETPDILCGSQMKNPWSNRLRSDRQKHLIHLALSG
jgi:hypothetical protein